MKAEVIRKYKDKNTGKTHNKGDVLNIGDERFEQLFNAGFLTFIEEGEQPVEVSPSKIDGKKNVKLKNLKNK